MNYFLLLKVGLSCLVDLINNIGIFGFFCKFRSVLESLDIYICSNNYVLLVLNILLIGYNIVYLLN